MREKVKAGISKLYLGPESSSGRVGPLPCMKDSGLNPGNPYCLETISGCSRVSSGGFKEANLGPLACIACILAL